MSYAFYIAFAFSINDSVEIDKPVLIPLTSSLYVPGTLADTEKVIVDVGTGFYVEKVGIEIFILERFTSHMRYNRAPKRLPSFMRIKWRSWEQT